MRFLKVDSLFQQDDVENAIWQIKGLTSLKSQDMNIKSDTIISTSLQTFPRELNIVLNQYERGVGYTIHLLVHHALWYCMCFTYNVGYLFVWMSVGLIFYSLEYKNKEVAGLGNSKYARFDRSRLWFDQSRYWSAEFN